MQLTSCAIDNFFLKIVERKEKTFLKQLSELFPQKKLNFSHIKHRDVGELYIRNLTAFSIPYEACGRCTRLPEVGEMNFGTNVPQ